MRIHVRLDKSDISEELRERSREDALEIVDRLWLARDKFEGWVHSPAKVLNSELLEIEKVSNEIQEKYDAMVVVGIGGSYLVSA